MEKNTAIVDLNDYLDLVNAKKDYMINLENYELMENDYKALLNNKIAQLDSVNELMEKVLVNMFDKEYVKGVKIGDIKSYQLKSFNTDDKIVDLLNSGEYNDYLFKVLKINKGEANE